MGGRFLTELHVRVLRDDGPRPLLELTAPLHYHSDLIGTVIVPAGFCFDGASVPGGLIGGAAAAAGISPATGLRAAAVHDALIVWAKEGFASVERETADNVFREALEACGVDDYVAHLMYASVAAYTQSLRQQAAGDDPYKATA